LIPILLWNLALTNYLPRQFSPEIFDNIPAAIGYGENVLRMFVFFLPLLMPLQFSSRGHIVGLVVFIIGVLIYFSSWLPLIFFPDSVWSTSFVGFLAPFYTPFIWMIGIGLIGNTLFVPIPYCSWVYIVLSFLFTTFHCWHGIIVYRNNF
jgi:hypothetical protein